MGLISIFSPSILTLEVNMNNIIIADKLKQKYTYISKIDAIKYIKKRYNINIKNCIKSYNIYLEKIN